MFLCPGDVVKIEIHSVVYKTIASAHLRGLLSSSLNFRIDFVMLFPHYVRRLLLAWDFMLSCDSLLTFWFCSIILQDKSADRKRKLQEQAERLQFDDSAKELVR